MVLHCKAIIFDLDGVLVDSKEVVEKHWRMWAERHQLDPGKILRIAHGRRTADTIAVVAPMLDAILEAEKLELKEAPDTDGLRTYARANHLIKGLHAGSWAVATSGTKPTALKRLEFANLPVPEVLITAEDIEHGKPDPEVYLLAASRLGITPSNCIVVEDAPAGIESARRAGMVVVAVATTHGIEQLKGASAIVPSITSLRIEHDKNNLVLHLEPLHRYI